MVVGCGGWELFGKGRTEGVCLGGGQRQRQRERNRRRALEHAQAKGGAPPHRWFMWLKGLFVPARAQVGYRLNRLKKCSCN